MRPTEPVPVPTSRWLSRRPHQGSRFRLFCFPYAGGGAGSFAPWQAALGQEIEVCAVQVPGRGARFLEPSIRSFQELVEALSDVVAAHADLPFALLGHSLGALTAFEVARALRRKGLPMPRHLLVSGCEAPHTRSVRPPLHDLGDAALLEELGKLNGTPAEILGDRGLMQLLLPAIRADFKFVADYEYRTAAPLDVAITVLAGLADDHVDRVNVMNWGVHTAAAHAIHWLPGDHFFIDSQRQAVLGILRPLLSPAGHGARIGA
jgi:medium-chain acyl-[acyl-carrier-protein] hydrolase